jgi:hypothetical protein
MQLELRYFWQGKSVTNMHTVFGLADIAVKGAVLEVYLSAVLPSFASRIEISFS